MSKEWDYFKYQEALYQVKIAMWSLIECLNYEKDGDEKKVKYELHKLADEVYNEFYEN